MAYRKPVKNKQSSRTSTEMDNTIWKDALTEIIKTQSKFPESTV